jgi:membrane protease YdiL (CAAX protease family)
MTQTPDDRPTPVAAYRHTAILTVAFLAIAVAGALSVRTPAPEPGKAAGHPEVIPLYLSLLAAEWGLVYYVWRVGLKRAGTRMRDLIGGRWSRARDVARDLALAALVWAIWLGIERACDLWLGSDQARSVESYLPRGPAEVGLWIALSLSAGFCEEVAFRGYFQRQFAALTRSRTAGLVMQALLFGVSHGYQGAGAAIRITLFGLLFGALARSRRSLRPGMAAHAWTDVYSGWLSLLK